MNLSLHFLFSQTRHWFTHVQIQRGLIGVTPTPVINFSKSARLGTLLPRTAWESEVNLYKSKVPRKTLLWQTLATFISLEKIQLNVLIYGLDSTRKKIAPYGAWRWVSSKKVATYTNWAPGQPDNGNAHCVLIWLNRYPYTFKWDNQDCKLQNFFVCERGEDEINASPYFTATQCDWSV